MPSPYCCCLLFLAPLRTSKCQLSWLHVQTSCTWTLAPPPESPATIVKQLGFHNVCRELIDLFKLCRDFYTDYHSQLLIRLQFYLLTCGKRITLHLLLRRLQLSPLACRHKCEHTRHLPPALAPAQLWGARAASTMSPRENGPSAAAPKFVKTACPTLQ